MEQPTPVQNQNQSQAAQPAIRAHHKKGKVLLFIVLILVVIAAAAYVYKTHGTRRATAVDTDARMNAMDLDSLDQGL